MTETETETLFVVVCYSEIRRNLFGDIFEKVDFVPPITISKGVVFDETSRGKVM